ncbi:MAG: TonB-dependent receptor [Bacteroidetes bacterium]|nr:TonB-dependent receptor [Bacteroidota bacterium]
MKRILFLSISILSTFILQAQKKNSKTDTIKIWGACEMCKERIENAAHKVGVYKANWNVETHLLIVSYDSLKITKAKIEQKIADAGHDTEDYVAKAETYEKLPECCHYIRKDGTSDTGKNPINPTEHLITGIVLEENNKGKFTPLANAYIKYISHNSSTIVTDSTGIFRMSVALPATVQVSYVGFVSDTLKISEVDDLKIILKSSGNNKLNEVVVTSRTPSSYISRLSTLNTLNLGARELTKAACCNLSESFETSPSVDVSYADAVTGMKQIQLLGLSGNYSQMLVENLPALRGLPGSFGLTFIPGPWVESIQVTKGTGSVVNGYESIAGQINVEEKKPDGPEKLLVNLYGNDMGRLEANVNIAQKINNKWSSALLLHGNNVSMKTDKNKDGFLDLPIGNQINVVNRWKYIDNKGFIFQTAIKALKDKRQAGQVDFNPTTDKFTTNAYGAGLTAEQYEAQTKIGYVFPQQKYKSIGFMISGVRYKSDAYYGLTSYTGDQKSFYANLIYQSIIGNSNHKFRTGFSWAYDKYNEKYKLTNFNRIENVPGLFFEYTFNGIKNLDVIAGIRSDFHNQYKTQITPRLHAKYTAGKNTSFRFSAGSGFRTANIFAENTGLMASARQFVINGSSSYGYGLQPEKATNYGIGIVQNFKKQNRTGSISLDAYHTQFNNQVVVDVDASPQKVYFYNLIGKSYSTSIQLEVNYPLLPGFDVRAAYRWLNVKTTYSGNLMEKPLTAKHRAFINLAYEAKGGWKFDYTMQWLSSKRLPNTASNPVDKQMGNYSPGYVLANAQISKQFGKNFELYLGSENLGNFKQKSVIIDAAHPFSNYFDASMVWGPVSGRMIYSGLRYKLKNK